MNKEAVAQLIKSLKEYKNYSSQLELANALGVTQATVSRLESGKQNISPKTLRRVNELLGLNITRPKVELEKIRKSNLPKSEGAGVFTSEFNYAYSKIEMNDRGGDFLRVSEIQKNELFTFLIGDSIGHGSGSAYMAFAMEFSYESVISVMHPQLITPSVIEYAVNNGVLATAKQWKGEPSLIIGSLKSKEGKIELINRGMPHPLVKSNTNSIYIREGRYKAIDLGEPVGLLKTTSSFLLNKGDSVLFYSDGLVELFSEEKLKAHFNKVSKLFEGDSRAIAKNIYRIVMAETKDGNLEDDITFLVISRRK